MTIGCNQKTPLLNSNLNNGVHFKEYLKEKIYEIDSLKILHFNDSLQDINQFAILSNNYNLHNEKDAEITKEISILIYKINSLPDSSLCKLRRDFAYALAHNLTLKYGYDTYVNFFSEENHGQTISEKNLPNGVFRIEYRMSNDNLRLTSRYFEDETSIYRIYNSIYNQLNLLKFKRITFASRETDEYHINANKMKFFDIK